MKCMSGYWSAHGTSLLRAAPEHVKPAVYKDTGATVTMDPLDRAKLALFGVRNRGVTHYTDLTKSNKRKREEIDSDEETEELDREYLDDTDLGWFFSRACGFVGNKICRNA